MRPTTTRTGLDSRNRRSPECSSDTGMVPDYQCLWRPHRRRGAKAGSVGSRHPGFEGAAAAPRRERAAARRRLVGSEVQGCRDGRLRSATRCQDTAPTRFWHFPCSSGRSSRPVTQQQAAASGRAGSRRDMDEGSSGGWATSACARWDAGWPATGCPSGGCAVVRPVSVLYTVISSPWWWYTRLCLPSGLCCPPDAG